MSKKSMGINKSSFHIQQNQIAQANYLSETGNKKKAIKIYKELLKEALISNNSSLILEINKQLSNIYTHQKNYDNALTHYKKYTKINMFCIC